MRLDALCIQPLSFRVKIFSYNRKNFLKEDLDMKKKFDWNAPLTRKDYAILWIFVFGIYTICCGISIAKIYDFSFKDWIGGMIKKKNKSEEKK